MFVKLIFSFDSEDYETPEADDAEKWWAETMSKHGITACVCVVGELARSLRRSGRKDVIDAMSKHEIAFHSDMHSAHPTWAEYLDKTGWADGVAWIMQKEAKGITDVCEILGQRPFAWCKPGASWGPQVAHAMTQMDVPLFCDSPFESSRGQPLWYDNSLFLMYHTSFDRYFNVPHQSQERLNQMKEDFSKLCGQHQSGYLIMYTHPCRLFTAKFTDTFRNGKNPPREEWAPAPLRPAQEIAELQQDFDRFLEWVVKQPMVELTTYRKLYTEYQPAAAPWLNAEETLKLANLELATELNYQKVNESYLSPAEQFGLMSQSILALGEKRHLPHLPNAIAVRRLLGPVETPPNSISSDSVSVGNFFDTAKGVNDFCTREGAVPAKIQLGDKTVGPNAFMQAASGLITKWNSTGKIPRFVDVQPISEEPAITKRPDFQRFKFKDNWSIFPSDFEGNNVLEMIRLQSWTAKPA